MYSAQSSACSLHPTCAVLARLPTWAVFPVAEVAILGIYPSELPWNGEFGGGETRICPAAQQNVAMPRRCYAQAISFLPGRGSSSRYEEYQDQHCTALHSTASTGRYVWTAATMIT